MRIGYRGKLSETTLIKIPNIFQIEIIASLAMLPIVSATVLGRCPNHGRAYYVTIFDDWAAGKSLKTFCLVTYSSAGLCFKLLTLIHFMHWWTPAVGNIFFKAAPIHLIHIKRYWDCFFVVIFEIFEIWFSLRTNVMLLKYNDTNIMNKFVYVRCCVL